MPKAKKSSFEERGGCGTAAADILLWRVVRIVNGYVFAFTSWILAYARIVTDVKNGNKRQNRVKRAPCGPSPYHAVYCGLYVVGLYVTVCAVERERDAVGGPSPPPPSPPPFLFIVVRPFVAGGGVYSATRPSFCSPLPQTLP